MKRIVESGWAAALAGEFQKDYFARLERFVDDAYLAGEVFPPADRIFSAFELTPLEKTRVVVLGQDPYHEPGQAQGLSFYVPAEVKMPPSLRNIAKELGNEYPGRSSSDRPDLLRWAAQGVLLLNATLTVAAGLPLSHSKRGWEEFTDAVIRILNARSERVIFLLWGAHAQKKGAMVDRARHCVIECAHPSPLSARRGFFGSNCFRKVNEDLVARGLTAISW